MATRVAVLDSHAVMTGPGSKQSLGRVSRFGGTHHAGNRCGRRAGSTDDLILGSKVRFLLGGLNGQASASRVTVPGSVLAFPVGFFSRAETYH